LNARYDCGLGCSRRRTETAIEGLDLAFSGRCIIPDGAESERGRYGVGDGVFVELIGVADWEEEGDQATVGRKGCGCDGGD